jgi:DNA-directed RNA polymerase subunit omega
LARITIEDCLKRVPNRFLLVHMAAKRVRQIREGHEYLVSSPKNEDIVVSLREIAAGKVIHKKKLEKKVDKKVDEKVDEEVYEQVDEQVDGKVEEGTEEEVEEEE